MSSVPDVSWTHINEISSFLSQDGCSSLAPLLLIFILFTKIFTPPPSWPVWVPWFILFLIQTLISYLKTVAAGQKLDESER